MTKNLPPVILPRTRRVIRTTSMSFVTIISLVGCYQNNTMNQNPPQTWPAGAVTYQFVGGEETDHNTIRQAMTELSEYANVHFIEEENGQLLITFEAGRTYAKLGYKPLKYRRANFAVCSLYTARHELLHVLGLIHEHQRPDRDQYIEVDMDNVRPDKVDQWQIMEPLFDYTGLEYDIDSIMHYYSSGYSVNNKVVFAYQGQYIHENYTVSNGDIKKCSGHTLPLPSPPANDIVTTTAFSHTPSYQEVAGGSFPPKSPSGGFRGRYIRWLSAAGAGISSSRH